jgi:hypothetical protein
MIKRFLFLCLMLFSHLSVSAGITDLKLSTAQIFDVQWYISGGRLYASGFSYIYASVNYATQTTSAARWTLAQTQDASANGRYIGFFNSTTNPGTYGMAVFNSDGTRYKTINNTGSFAALADGAIFYNGNGMWGTLITTGQGYNNGQSGNWAVTQSNPTNTQLQAYTPPSSTPLAAGQTAPPPGPPPPAPTAIYMNNATVNITRAIPTTANSPGSEGPNNAFDNNPNTKYLNFDKKNAGVTVQLNTGRAVTGFTVTTANDFSGRDPTSYKLYGSNDGSTWVLIKQDTLTLSENRFATSAVVDVANTTPYVYYFMLFPTTKAGDGCGLNCDSMQIAEITYYYDANSTATSTASSNTIVDPVTAANNTLCCGGSAAAFNANATNTAKVLTFTSRTTADSKVNIEQLGTQNEVDVTQSGTRNNYVNYYGNGLSNSVEITQQGNASTQVNYVDLRVVGNFNTVNIEQTSTGGAKGAFVNVQNNNNTLILKQQDSGSHYAEITLSGGNKTVDVLQQGSAGHMVSVTLTGPQPSSLNLIQAGATQQYYSITNNCTTVGGCAPISVTQGK